MGGESCSIEARSLSNNSSRRAMMLFAISLWCFSEKSCVPDSELKPTPAFAEKGALAWLLELPVVDEKAVLYRGTDGQIQPFPDITVRSLKQAAKLLNQAADVVGKNEGLAVQFIRQAIAILKNDVIRKLNMPDADHVTTMRPSPFTAPRALTEAVDVSPETKGRP